MGRNGKSGKNRSTKRRRAKRAQAAAVRESQSIQGQRSATSLDYDNSARMEWDLEITLRSDLCVATGDGFSSGIDVDVCLDMNGMPVIPARRLKGCLRSAAELAAGPDEEMADALKRLFGEGGTGQSGSIVVEDATVMSLGGVDTSAVLRGAKPQEITDLMTYVRAQTALVPGEGYAKENTLRYIRVVKQYDPLSLKGEADRDSARPLVFVARIVADACYGQLLERAALALRGIGFGRNRGFGAVSCRLVRKRPHVVESRPDGAGSALTMGNGMRIAYTVHLDTPLMLPQQKGIESLSHVPGTSVLGYFARKLVGTDVFDDVVLSGKVRFSPLYPTDAGGRRCVPAPPFILKAKGGLIDGELYTNLAWNRIAGNLGEVTPKPLKNGFVGGDWRPVDTKTEVIYHHSTGKTAGSLEPTLYTQRVLSAGQELAGFIEADDAELLDTVLNVLKSAGKSGLSFGRSKTAQYSRCTLVDMRSEKEGKVVELKKGRSYAFLLDSDVLVGDEGAGRLSADFSTLVHEIRHAMGDANVAFEMADVQAGVAYPGTSLAYRTITGYNAKWNQKKPHVRAVAAGSAIAFEAAKNATMPAEFWIGMRCSEGFGHVMVVNLDDITCPIEAHDTHLGLDAQDKQDVSSFARSQERLETLRCCAIDYAESLRHEGYFGEARLNPAFVGRLTRMVEESGARRSLDERVQSVKIRKKQEDAASLVSGLSAHLLGRGFGSVTWPEEKECLMLVLTLAKYYGKQAGVATGKAFMDGGDDVQ